MREIKFKAWDKKEKKMLNRFEITQDGFVGYTDMFETYHPLPEVVLIQYTGLKDKNGVEIYEGNIVEIDTGAIGEVVFNDECAYFSIETKTGIFLFEDIPLKAIKVIGNIFENKELLNG